MITSQSIVPISVGLIAASIDTSRAAVQRSTTLFAFEGELILGAQSKVLSVIAKPEVLS